MLPFCPHSDISQHGEGQLVVVSGPFTLLLLYAGSTRNIMLHLIPGLTLHKNKGIPFSCRGMQHSTLEEEEKILGPVGSLINSLTHPVQ